MENNKLDKLANGLYKLVIFDFDGTLYEPNKMAKSLVFGDLLNAFKAYKERKARKAMRGNDYGNSENFYTEFFARIGNNAKEWYFDKYMPLMVKILKTRFEARPHAQEIIDKLQNSGTKVVVLSDYTFVAERMAAIGLSLPQEQLFSTEDFGALKPVARPFLELASKYGIEPSNCLIVGDRPDTDLAGAKAAGMDGLVIKTKKYEKEQIEEMVEWQKFSKQII